MIMFSIFSMIMKIILLNCIHVSISDVVLKNVWVVDTLGTRLNLCKSNGGGGALFLTAPLLSALTI